MLKLLPILIENTFGILRCLFSKILQIQYSKKQPLLMIQTLLTLTHNRNNLIS
jgi:hypothetical protein